MYQCLEKACSGIIAEWLEKYPAIFAFHADILYACITLKFRSLKAGLVLS